MKRACSTGKKRPLPGIQQVGAQNLGPYKVVPKRPRLDAQIAMSGSIISVDVIARVRIGVRHLHHDQCPARW